MNKHDLNKRKQQNCDTEQLKQINSEAHSVEFNSDECKSDEYKRMLICTLQQTKLGQQVSGDSYFIHETEHYSLVVLVDGLGSGPFAREAADRAIESVKYNHHEDVSEILLRCNEALRGTRGVVAGCFRIDYAQHRATFVGVGNIQCFILNPGEPILRGVSKPGYLNGRPIQIVKQHFQLSNKSMFLLFSDGLELNRALLLQMANVQDPSALVNNLKKIIMPNSDDITLVAGQYCSTT